jgi:four helix bundle protein
VATIQRYEEIQSWQKARELTSWIYAVTQQDAFARDWGLRDQIRGAAVSVMSNIAEGFERGSRQEFIQFLSVAKASAGEVQSQLYAALDRSTSRRSSSPRGMRCATTPCGSSAALSAICGSHL